MNPENTIALLAENGHTGTAEPVNGPGQVGRVRLDTGAIVMLYRTKTALVQGRCTKSTAAALLELLADVGWNPKLNAEIVDMPEEHETGHVAAADAFAPTEKEEEEGSGTVVESSSIVLSDDQAIAFAQVCVWLDSGKQTLTLGGYAGTGKTTLIREIVRRLGGRVNVCAPTGKAAHVLRCKGVPAQTLHSLIYEAKRYRDPASGTYKWRFKLTSEGFDVVIVDEASMLTTDLVRDVKRVARKVLFVGDHGQLQPVGDDPGIMHTPKIRLERIHRQAEGSPVIRFAQHVRLGGEPQTFDDEHCRVQQGGSVDLADFDVILCGYNKTRVRGNAWVRRRRGFDGALPKVGDRVICLQNNADYGIFNGQLCTVREVGSFGVFTVEDDAGEVYRDLPFDFQQFGRAEKLQPVEGLTQWDFGYVLTVHKAQGSEFKKVAVIEELAPSWSPMRWRYTAATRASETLRWCVGGLR